MFSSSLLLRLVVPYVTALSFIAFALLYVVPNQQETAILKEVTGQLEAISQTAAGSVKIAIEEEDFSSLSMINRLLESNPNVTFAAIYIEEDGASELFALYPSELADDATFLVDEVRYLMRSHPVETTFLKGNVLVGYDKTLFAKQALSLNTPVYLSFLFILLVQILSYRTIDRSVIGPIRKAASAADAISTGQLDSSLELTPRSDEIGLLHDALQNLQSSLLAEEKKNRELMASLEDRVKERTVELQEALLTKDNFLSSVSHELRTPLHSIISSLELQLQDANEMNLSTESIDIVENGLIAARSLLSLINDLLDYQKFASLGVELRPQSTPMMDLLQRLESVAGPLFDSDAVRLRSAYVACEGLWINVDAQRLEQVLVNLLANARKFTREGEVLFNVQAEVTKGNAHCIFSIADTGIGMDEDTISRLGEPFFQNAEGYRRTFGGTGLGISIVKRLLEAMGSELEVSSTLGKGSTFSFSIELPIVKPLQIEADAGVGIPLIAEHLRVLYVEDVEVNQFFMVAMAKRLKAELTLASSALEGYDLIKKQLFDLILTDIQMPEHDGTELLQWIRENPDIPDDLPIFAFTAHAENERMDQFLAMGFDHVLTKPLQFRDLLAALEPIKRRVISDG